MLSQDGFEESDSQLVSQVVTTKAEAQLLDESRETNSNHSAEEDQGPEVSLTDEVILVTLTNWEREDKNELGEGEANHWQGEGSHEGSQNSDNSEPLGLVVRHHLDHADLTVLRLHLVLLLSSFQDRFKVSDRACSGHGPHIL